MTDAVDTEILTSLSERDAAAIEALLGQLSTSAVFDSALLNAMMEHDATERLVARVDGRVVGMATLVSFPLPTGMRGLVEDVVTDSTVRGRGIGRTLLMAMIDLAAKRRFRSLELTSRPSREAANRLYAAVGFSRRETNVWRFASDAS